MMGSFTGTPFTLDLTQNCGCGSDCAACCGVICGTHTIPTTLHATITSACAGINGKTAVLTYDGISAWFGNTDGSCGNTVYIIGQCAVGNFIINASTSPFPTCTCMVDCSGNFNTGTYSPFNRSNDFDWTGAVGCGCCAADNMVITVTA